MYVGDEGKYIVEEVLKKMPDYEIVKDLLLGGLFTAFLIIEI
jgi:hypothetical protein